MPTKFTKSDGSSDLLVTQGEALANNAPTISDKWILSSALQKLIRRGLTAQAIATAIRLHQVDPTYLRRRLPIICLEDIGLGDVAVCQKVLEACASAKLWRDWETACIELISAMAGAVKSRGACDAYCLTEVHEVRHALLSKFLEFPAEVLVEVASDIQGPLVDRLYALRVLGGIKDDNYRTVSRCNLEALDAVAINLGLPVQVRWLMSRQSQTAEMAAMLPVVFELARDSVLADGVEFPRAVDIMDGIPLCSLDQYTRLGKTALKQFASSSALLKEFSKSRIRGASSQALINLAMFQIESCVLDRFLSSPGLDRLKQQVDDAELVNLGLIDAQDREGLVRLLRAEAERLAAIRIQLLSKQLPIAM